MTRYRHIWKILFFDLFIIEFGPVGVFFLTYYFSDFITAALSLGIATFATLIISRIVNNRVPWFAIFSGSATILLALTTYIFTAPWILIVSESVYYALFVILIIIWMIKKQSLFQTFFGHIFAITAEGWKILELRWLIFFILATLSNEYVRIFFTVDEWVIYKQIITVVFLLFGLYQFRISIKYRLEEADRFGLRRNN